MGVPAPVGSTINCGLFADSRLARLRAVECGVVRAMLTRSLPVTSAVTFRSYHWEAVTGPDEAVIVGEKLGAVLYVIRDSTQVSSSTARTSIPLSGYCWQISVGLRPSRCRLAPAH